MEMSLQVALSVLILYMAISINWGPVFRSLLKELYYLEPILGFLILGNSHMGLQPHIQVDAKAVQLQHCRPEIDVVK